MADFEELETEIIDCLSGDEPIRTTGSIRSELKKRGVIEDCSIILRICEAEDWLN